MLKKINKMIAYLGKAKDRKDEIDPDKADSVLHALKKLKEAADGLIAKVTELKGPGSEGGS